MASMSDEKPPSPPPPPERPVRDPTVPDIRETPPPKTKPYNPVTGD